MGAFCRMREQMSSGPRQSCGKGRNARAARPARASISAHSWGQPAAFALLSPARSVERRCAKEEHSARRAAQGTPEDRHVLHVLGDAALCSQLHLPRGGPGPGRRIGELQSASGTRLCALARSGLRPSASLAARTPPPLEALATLRRRGARAALRELGPRPQRRAASSFRGAFLSQLAQPLAAPGPNGLAGRAPPAMHRSLT